MTDIEPRARDLHDRSIVIDGCSFFLRGFSDRLASAGTTAINFTVPLPMDGPHQAVERIVQYHGVAQREPRFRIAYTVDDIRQAKAEGGFAIIIGAQNSRLVGTELEWVPVFQRLGLRVMQLTYNERNFVADGCLEPRDAGLSFFGKRLIRALNEQHIVVDLSHGSVRSTLEAAEVSDAPIILSHVGIRRLVDSPRAATDEQIKAVADTGGVVGVTSHPNFNWRGGERRPHLNDFLDGLEAAIEIVGIDHVGIGTDHVVEPNGYPLDMQDYLARTYDPYSEKKASVAQGVRRVMGGLDPREDQLEGFGGMQHLPRVTEGLLQRGYKEADVEKVLGGNFMRVFDAVWR